MQSIIYQVTYRYQPELLIVLLCISKVYCARKFGLSSMYPNINILISDNYSLAPNSYYPDIQFINNNNKKNLNVFTIFNKCSTLHYININFFSKDHDENCLTRTGNQMVRGYVTASTSPT